MIGALPPVFAGLPHEYQHEAASWLAPVTVEPGETVMMEGEEDTTLAFIANGTCEIWRGETKIGTAGTREMLGEVELFGQIPRICSVTASTQLHLHVLGADALTALAERGNPVVYHLERAVIRRMSERIGKMNEGLAQYTRGRPFVLNPRQPTLVDKLTAPFRKKPKVPDLDPVEVLRRSELFSWAAAPVVEDIARQFHAERYDPEQVVCRQGEEGDRMYLIASGTVEIVVLFGQDRAETVATLGPGAAFGDAALSLSTPRTASCVSRDEVVALVLERPQFRELYESDEPVGSAFRQGIIRNLILQLIPATDRYAAAVASATPPDDGMYKGTPLNSMWRD